MNDVIMTDQLVRLTSRDVTIHNFTTSFSPDLTFTDEGQWSVAIAEIFIPRTTVLLTVGSLFGSNEQLASWRFYYDKSGVGSTISNIDQSVTENIFDTLGDNMTKADILQAIFAYGFNSTVKAIKSDSSITKAFWLDGTTPLHQRFVWEGDNLVLKGTGANGGDGWLRMSNKLFNLLGLVILSSKSLSKYLYPRGFCNDNYDFKTKLTWRLANNNTELYLYANVDWVFVNMKTSPLIGGAGALVPLHHVDIRSDVVSDSSKAFTHAAVPFGGITITPSIRDYRPLAKGSYSSIRVWISNAGSSTPLRISNRLYTDDKTHMVLHFKKEKQNLRGDYRRDHPTMVF